MAYFINSLNQKIAYKYTKGKSPGIIFIHGLNSNMQGLKALTIEKYAKKNNLSFLRFDCRGHGKSFGKFENFTISDWKRDIIDLLDNVVKGPQIIVGSSMGAWLMMLAANARQKKVSALLGLAAATDFGKSMYMNLSQKSKKEIQNKGSTKIKSYDFSYILTKKFFTEAKKNNILTKPFRFNKPFILIHGLKDDVVNHKMPQKIMNNTTSKNVQVHYLKSSDHRLSSEEDLRSITKAIDTLRILI
jgi:esterase/lipase